MTEILPKQVEANRLEILALKEKFDMYEKDIIHDSYRTKEMIVTAVTEGVAPAMAQQALMMERIRKLEDAPKDKVFHFMKWAMAALGTVTVTLIIALLKSKIHI